jgi:putative nucleotidyltransferase with HDIG domain
MSAHKYVTIERIAKQAPAKVAYCTREDLMSIQCISNIAIDTQVMAYLSPKVLGLQEFQDRFPRKSYLDLNSLAKLQNRLNTQTLMEYKHLQEIPVFYELKQNFSEVISKLTPAMKAKDAQLYGHSQRVQSLAISLTSNLNLPENEMLTIGLAAFFHDIGKMSINDKILYKPSGLTRKEFEVIKGHPAHGAKMLSHVKVLKNVVPLVYYHHERWDGNGYPDGICGEAIPFGARIIAIVDAFEAMTSQRNYQYRRTPLQALEELNKHAGTQFDAQLVEFFCKSLEMTLRDSINVR